MTPWLVRLDEVTEQAGVSELVLTAHAGWNGERTRGSTALNDWPDVLMTLNRDENTGQRLIRAEGRDVDVPEDGLHFDPTTRRLSLTGSGSRSAAKAEDKQADLVAATCWPSPTSLASPSTGWSSRSATAVPAASKRATSDGRPVRPSASGACASRLGRGEHGTTSYLTAHSPRLTPTPPMGARGESSGRHLPTPRDL